MFDKKILIFLCYITTFSCHAQINYPADISFCIADLKFDGQNIKICEFGQGTLSRFKGHDALYGCGAVWYEFWKYLSKFNKPFWFTTPENYALTKNNLELNLRGLEKFGGHTISSIGKLDSNPEFQKIVNSKQFNNPSSITSYDAIVIVNRASFGVGFLADFNSKYPSALLVDQAASFFVNSKYETDLLFKHPELQKYRPKSILCKCIFHKKLAREIAKKLGCEKYVIKPLKASRGRGVIIIDKLHLTQELKKILTEKNTLNPNDPTYKYWIDSKDKYFLVEEFVTSKAILFADKNYDATMRVMFVLSHDSGKIAVDFLGAYWKLPSGALQDYGNLTKKHKSNIDKNKKCSAMVDPQDFDLVKKELTQAMSKAYILMLDKLADNTK